MGFKSWSSHCGSNQDMGRPKHQGMGGSLPEAPRSFPGKHTVVTVGVAVLDSKGEVVFFISHLHANDQYVATFIRLKTDTAGLEPCFPFRVIDKVGASSMSRGRSHLQHPHGAVWSLSGGLSVFLFWGGGESNHHHSALQLSPPRAASSKEVKHPVILGCSTERNRKRGEKKEGMCLGRESELTWKTEANSRDPRQMQINGLEKELGGTGASKGGSPLQSRAGQ